MRFFTFLVLIFIGIINKAQAQSCSTIQGMTPQTAIAVCGSTSFYQSFVNNCTGPDVVPPPCPDGLTTKNSYWYKFHCYAPGSLGLGFIIKPDLNSDDFDWALFDVTGHSNLNDIYTMPATMLISSNISGNTGQTGCTPSGTGSANCPADPELNRLAPMQLNHDYMLMVTNWSGSGQGYHLGFSGGDAVIENNILPVITNVGIVGCNTALLRVTFSKDIHCSSVTISGSEFSFLTPGPVINGVTAACSSPLGTITELIIQLQNPLAAGNYDLTVNPGTDGDTFTDACGDSMVIGFQKSFTVPLTTPVTISSVNYGGCAPTILDVPLSKPVWCSSVTVSGSEFSILPGNPTIASVQSTCSSGGMYTDTLHIVLQNPLAAANYQLVVNNGTDGNTLIDTCGNAIPVGSTKSFVISATTTPPVIQSVVFDNCHPDKVVLNFNKPVSCASLTASGSELSISPGVWPLNSITYTCTGGIYTSQVTMNLLNSLPAGNFSVNVNNGTDANTLSDTCLSFMVAGYTKSFVTTLAPKPKFDSVQFNKCSPGFIKVFYDHAIQCSSVSADGSDFTITGPSPVNVISASTDITCAQGYTNWIQLQLAAPITVYGIYVLHNGVGTDANGIIDTCSAGQNIAETFPLTILGKPSSAFGGLVKWGCTMDTIALFHPGGNGINSWIWNFSDGTTLSGQSVSPVFPVSTPSVDVQLICSNGFCSDSTTINYMLGNVFNAGFSNLPKDTTCLGIAVNVTDTSSGNIINYLWDYGNGIQFNGQNPPPYTYPVTGAYTIMQVVTDNHGCTDTATSKFVVTKLPAFDFNGLASQYCANNLVRLTRQPYPDFLSYTWDNGDGVTFDNNVHVEFRYPNEGIYTITLTGLHKYCGPTQVSKTVPVYAVPFIYLGNDTVMCPNTQLQIGTIPVSGYTYSWNTGIGVTSSQILTDIFTRYYKLTIDNHGCRASDDINVKVLPACLIKVPGAFTPNADGVNDRLKAVNADLARDFYFKVYNRLGQLVYSTNIPTEGWDGTYKGVKLESGTYVWDLRYVDGLTGKLVVEKGTSILLR